MDGRHIKQKFCSVIFLVLLLQLQTTVHVSAIEEGCANCGCCVNNECAEKHVTENGLSYYVKEYCTLGCTADIWGQRCYNKCPRQCLTCAQNVENKCTSCKEGKYLSYGRCFSCNERCKSCTSATKCQKCVDPYYNTGNVTDCSLSCPGNCICQEIGVCSFCKNGFNNINNECQNTCPNNCKTCNSNINCLSCKDGFYLGINNEARDCSLRCPDTCSKCSSSSTCTQCNTGWHGSICQSQCSVGCFNGQCSIRYGRCSCKNWFKGIKCDECKLGRHGKYCEKTCSVGCKDNVCNRTTGRCSECKSTNIVGEFCDQCVDGKWGSNCASECPPRCNESECERKTGNCKTCEGNFHGKQCDSCKGGYYGSNCESECPENCENQVCHQSDGTCLSCERNFAGPHCNNCAVGWHGGGCNTPCSSKNCFGNTCDRDTGKCTSCPKGFYGSLCKLNCSQGCKNESCDFVNGNCLECKTPYSGDKCCIKDTESHCLTCLSNSVCKSCDNGFYGMNCKKTCQLNCSKNDQKLRCERISGNCSSCNIGFYGGHCDKICSTKCLYSRCVQESGHCMEGCTDSNFEGPTCTQATTPPDTASVAGGVVATIIIIIIIVVIVIFMFRRRRSFGGHLKDLKDDNEQSIAQLPDDHSSVKIKGDRKFFINACYIDGFQSPNCYIASLGPTEKATDKFYSFWKMVWHMNTDVIVMLTNLREPSGNKCDQYWPDMNCTNTHRDFVVSCRCIEVFAEYTVRTFTIEKKSRNRTVYQFHYTAWPDKNIPDEVTSLVEFRQRVRSAPRILQGPIIVHCSAGVGRTGTYIALDRLTETGEAGERINVYECVYQMRQQRVNMVQTLEQYEFLHKALVHTLTFNCEAIRAEDFETVLRDTSEECFRQNFQLLKTVMGEESSEEIQARRTNGSHGDKNRKKSDIPGDRYRPRLYICRRFNSSDYINAVYVNGFKKKDQYIIAQSPLPETVFDFICLIFQENCYCVVSMEDPDLIGTEIGDYLGTDNQALTCGSFTVKSSRCAPTHHYVLRKLSIKNKDRHSSGERVVYHYQLNNWKHSEKVPTDAHQFAQCVKDVSNKASGMINEQGPILVHCLNGAKRSGLFCAVGIILEKIEAEGQASVPNTLRQLRTRRKKAIPNKEQFEFCFRSVKAHLELNNTYSNFVQ